MTPSPTTQLIDALKYLSADHLPDANWIIGGGFRFDQVLLNTHSMLQQHVIVRQLGEVYASLPLRWSLDWYQREKTLRDSQIRRLLSKYSSLGLALNLSFDNPFLPDTLLRDSFGWGMIEEMLHFDKNKRNGLFIAHDKLAASIRQQRPQLRLTCHVNRLIAERQRRSPLLYKKLLAQYDRVTLHPNDALRPSMYEAIEDKARCAIIVNDPCLQSCPVRYEHLRLLAKQREEPFEALHRGGEAQLIERIRCQHITSLSAGQSCNLSIAHMQKLYGLGYRHFIVQAERFRSPATLIWDIFNSLFTHDPQYSNKVAALSSNIIANFNNAPRPRLKSGMPASSMDEY